MTILKRATIRLTVRRHQGANQTRVYLKAGDRSEGHGPRFTLLNLIRPKLSDIGQVQHVNKSSLGEGLVPRLNKSSLVGTNKSITRLQIDTYHKAIK